MIIDGWWCLPGGWWWYLVSVEWSSAAGVIVVSSWWMVVASLPGVLVVFWCPRGVLVSSVVSSWWLVVSSWWLVVAPWCWWCSSVAGGGSLATSHAYSQPDTQAGARAHPSVRRRSRLNGSLSGFFLIGYSFIYQLFKFSYRMLCAKVFRGENTIKSLFSANYRGYFIIQAAHLTINYSYFLHETDRKHVENQ